MDIVVDTKSVFFEENIRAREDFNKLHAIEFIGPLKDLNNNADFAIKLLEIIPDIEVKVEKLAENALEEICKIQRQVKVFCKNVIVVLAVQKPSIDEFWVDDLIKNLSSLCTHRTFESNCSIKIFLSLNLIGKWATPKDGCIVSDILMRLTKNDFDQRFVKSDELIYLTNVDDLLDKVFVNLTEANPIIPISTQKIQNYCQTGEQLHATIDSVYQSFKAKDTPKAAAGLNRLVNAIVYSLFIEETRITKITPFKDERGIFLEIFRTNETGQISLFTAKPGVTRGGHYHLNKVEKFIVITGSAEFVFQNIRTKKISSLKIGSQSLEVVETTPRVAHWIKNVGEDDLKVLVWANELFDEKAPDTYKWDLLLP